jgi:hypothetical protein
MLVAVTLLKSQLKNNQALHQQLRRLTLRFTEYEACCELHTLQWMEMFDLLNEHQIPFIFSPLDEQ